MYKNTRCFQTLSVPCRTRALAISTLLALLSSGCSPAVTVRVNCQPPPVPPQLLEPCPPPAVRQLPDGKMATLYQQSIADTDPWGQCVRRQSELAALVKYRDSVCASMAQPEEQPNLFTRLFGASK